MGNQNAKEGSLLAVYYRLCFTTDQGGGQGAGAGGPMANPAMAAPAQSSSMNYGSINGRQLID